MTASRASVLALALALLASAAGWAQDGGPVRLMPPEPDAGPLAEEGPGGIQIESLPDASFESAGVLEPGEGGLGRDLWAGTPREIITGNLGRLPAYPASPTLYDVQRRLLLTPAEVPRGLAVGHDVLTLRTLRLHAMGALDGLVELLDVLPPGDRSDAFGRVEVEARLAAGQTDEACAAAERHVRRHDDPLFGRVLVVCHVMRGEDDLAAFTLGLLREEGAVDDRYAGLLAALQGDASAVPGALPDPSPLEIAMYHAADRAVPAADLDTLSPLGVRAVLRAGRQAPAEAALLSERAVADGLIPFDAYEAAMRAADDTVTPRSPAQIEAIAPEAYEEDGFGLRRQIHASAMAEADAGRRALVLAAVWEWSLEHALGDRLLAYAMAGPLIEIEPQPNHAWFARDAARTLYEAGRRGDGDRWYSLLDRVSAVADLSALWPLAHLSDPGAAPWSDGRLRAWYDSASARGQGAAKRQAEMFYAAVDGLEGDALDRGDWRGVIDTRRAEAISATVPRVWRHARSAAFDGRRGEALLLALGAADDRGLSALDPPEVRTLVYILSAAGLEAEARSVAIEAFVAAGHE